MSDTTFDQRSVIHRDAWFPPCLVRQIDPKKNYVFLAILDHFQTKMFKSETTSFHYFSPKDSKSLKKIGHPISENGGKNTFKRYLKKEQMDTRTDRRTN